MGSASPGASIKLRAALLMSVLGRSIRRCTGWRKRDGWSHAGMSLKIIVAPNITSLRPQANGNWQLKQKTGSAFPWLLHAPCGLKAARQEFRHDAPSHRVVTQPSPRKAG